MTADARRSAHAALSPLEQPVPPRPPISIKGRDGQLRITVLEPEAGLAALADSLDEQLERRAGGFFAGAPVVLELPKGQLDLALAGRLAERIGAAGMALVAVLAGSDALGRAERFGGQAESSAQSRSTGRARPAPLTATDPALFVARTLRGGQRVEHGGSVVVMGDVNPGAEVLAGGSVVVWGRLRGLVEAGLNADEEKAVVCALDLQPTQLRIGNAIARAPEDPDRTPVPEVARVASGQIVVDEWR